jgi:hypothetical protein
MPILGAKPTDWETRKLGNSEFPWRNFDHQSKAILQGFRLDIPAGPGGTRNHTTSLVKTTIQTYTGGKR